MKQIYWKDAIHFYKIINKDCVIVANLSKSGTGNTKEYYEGMGHYLFTFIKKKQVVKSTKTEFINAYHKAIKKIGIKT